MLKAQLGDDTKAEIILGELSEEVMETLDLVVMSPGVPTDLPVVLKMRDMGIPIWGESSLLYIWKRRCACNHRNQWKDDDDCTFGRDYEEL